ncbi:MAG: hypothetical protein ABIN36_07970 [Ferruginibacter sp.]
MKMQSRSLFIELSNSTKEKLTTQVGETLAKELNKEKTFGSIDLWNIRRQGRLASGR